MNIKITSTTHGDIFTTMIGNQEFTQRYVGYSLEEARERFNDYVASELTDQILGEDFRERLERSLDGISLFN